VALEGAKDRVAGARKLRGDGVVEG